MGGMADSGTLEQPAGMADITVEDSTVLAESTVMDFTAVQVGMGSPRRTPNRACVRARLVGLITEVSRTVTPSAAIRASVGEGFTAEEAAAVSFLYPNTYTSDGETK